MKRKFAVWACLALLLTACEPIRGTNVGNFAPEIKATQLDGKVVKLSDLKGKVVLIDYWATWCGPCKSIMPAIDEAYRRHHDQGLEVMALSQEPKDTIQEFRAKTDFAYPFLLDRDGSASAAYDVDAIPRTLVVGRDGKVVYQETGADPEGLTKAVEDAISAGS